MALEFRKAVRRAVPQLICVASVSGGGKTYSALLLAAGLAGPDGTVAMIDTENGRGEMYADSPGIVQALPKGYLYIRFDPPYTPERYVEHFAAAERAGATVAVCDSGTHEWEGIGGVSEMAESEENQKKGRFGRWADPKMRHKRYVYYLLSSPMHVIFCLRARDQAKQIKKGQAIVLGPGQETSDAKIAEKDTVIGLGLQPIAERNFVFEMTVSLMLDEKTHFAAPIKVPEPLRPLFPGKHLITKEDGNRIREWNNAGQAMDPFERLIQRATATAENGTAAYVEFYNALTNPQKKAIRENGHEANKKIAAQADADRAAEPKQQPLAGAPIVERLPEAIEHVVGYKAVFQGCTYEVYDDGETHRWREA